MFPGGWIEGLSNSTNTFNNSKVYIVSKWQSIVQWIMLQNPFHLHLSSQNWTSRDQKMFLDCFKLSIYIITNRVFNTKVFHLDVSKQKNMHETYLKKKNCIQYFMCNVCRLLIFTHFVIYEYFYWLITNF